MVQTHTTFGSQDRCTALYCCSYTMTTIQEKNTQDRLLQDVHIWYSVIYNSRQRQYIISCQFLPKTISLYRNKKINIRKMFQMENNYTNSFVCQCKRNNTFYISLPSKITSISPEDKIFDQKQSKILPYSTTGYMVHIC